MASRLSVYNDALLICGERVLRDMGGGVIEDRPSRRYLDAAWDAGALDFILEDTDWNCHMVSVQIDKDTSLTPEFGYTSAHNFPDDLAKISGVFTDEDMRNPLTDHRVEGRQFYSYHDTIYLRYVPDSATVENAIAGWPTYFAALLAGELAVRVRPSIKASADASDIISEHRARQLQAESKDAMSQPTQELPAGSWVRARSGRGRYSHRRRP